MTWFPDLLFSFFIPDVCQLLIPFACFAFVMDVYHAYRLSDERDREPYFEEHYAS